MALKGMNEALTEQINNMSKINAAHIAAPCGAWPSANGLLAGGLDGLAAAIKALNRGFIDLWAEHPKHSPRSVARRRWRKCRRRAGG